MEQLKRNYLTNILILLVFLSSSAIAQELPPPDAEEPEPETTEATSDIEPEAPVPSISPDDFLDNPDLPYSGDLAEEEKDELFGPDEAIPEEELEEESAAKPDGNYLIIFELKATAEFQKPGEAPYFVMQYENSFETNINILSNRRSKEIDTEFEIKSSGIPFENEIAFCNYEFEWQEQLPAKITTRLNTTTEEDEDERTSSGAIKIEYEKKEGNEIWNLTCTDIPSGAKLITQGAPETYFLQIADTAGIDKMVIEDFDIGDEHELQILPDIRTFTDEDIGDDVTFSVEGKLTLRRL